MPESIFHPEHFERIDESHDSAFYATPRLVVHIDDGAVLAAGRLYASQLPTGGQILDLMSSWRSHLPDALELDRLIGLGMNGEEMARNPRLDEYVVHDLNLQPVLPFESNQFDGVINTVSVQYLTRPVEVFAEVYRVLRPGACYVVTFSNRCFPTKAVRIWRELNDLEHAQLVASYFRHSAEWHDVRAVDCGGATADGGDPLFAVHGRKPAEAQLSQATAGGRR